MKTYICTKCEKPCAIEANSVREIKEEERLDESACFEVSDWIEQPKRKPRKSTRGGQ